MRSGKYPELTLKDAVSLNLSAHEEARLELGRSGAAAHAFLFILAVFLKAGAFVGHFGADFFGFLK